MISTVNRALLCGVLLLSVLSRADAQPVLASDPFGAGKSSGDYTFADFCRENPTLGQPVGEPVVIEWLVASASAALPEQPTLEMVRAGQWVRQDTRLNRCATTEQWQQVDRSPEGRLVAAPQREGHALFTRLRADGDGRVELIFRTDWRRVSGWITNEKGEPEAVCERRETNSRVVLVFDQWLKCGGFKIGRSAKKTDGTETSETVQAGVYFRVIRKSESVARVP